MRVSAVILCSVLGMGTSSAAVSWLTPSSQAASPAAATEDVPKSATKTKRVETEPSTTVFVARPEPTSSFVNEGRLRLEGRLGHTVLPGERENETYLLVELGAQDIDVDSRAPVNLSIAIDRSGSMKGQRLRNAVAAARGMLSRLRPDDTISVVTYHERAQVLVPPTRVGSMDRFDFDRALADIRGDGNTCISCGIDMARAQLARRRDGINHILLLSDGVANRGLRTASDFRVLGDQLGREETSVASVGVDVDYDERMLLAVSQASNGNHYFVENPAGLSEVFDREAESLTGTIADRVDVDVQFAEGVEVVEVIARGARQFRDRVELSFGSFDPGVEKSALIRLRVEPGRGLQEVADVRLSYRDLADDRLSDSEGSVSVELDPDQRTLAALDPRVEERLGRKETFDALLEANESFNRGDVALAQRQLDEARTRIRRRRDRSGASKDSKLDKNFEAQLGALGGASSNFSTAAESAPTAAAAPASRAGKKAVRANAQFADPFG